MSLHNVFTVRYKLCVRKKKEKSRSKSSLRRSNGFNSQVHTRLHDINNTYNVVLFEAQKR